MIRIIPAKISAAPLAASHISSSCLVILTKLNKRALHQELRQSEAAQLLCFLVSLYPHQMKE
jgi:hypothetical protein